MNTKNPTRHSVPARHGLAGRALRPTRLTAASLLLALGAAPLAHGLTIDPEWTTARIWDETILASIRLSTPRPPVHARNLYTISAAMYDAWATYDDTARGTFFLEKHTAKDVEAARHEAISYAAYRVLKARYVAGNGPNIAAIQANIDAVFAELGFDKDFTSTVGDTPAAIGNRIASTILAAFLADNANEQGNYAQNNGYTVSNPELVFKLPGCPMNDPNRWQPLAFDFLVLQNGIIIGASIQVFICPHWGGVKPFALSSLERDSFTNLYFDQGGPPLVGEQAHIDDAVDMILKSSVLDPRSEATIDISPAVFHNRPLGSYESQGYGTNPVTGAPYPPNEVKLADYARTLAEFWADGPDSETPPGHWHVVTNDVLDHEGFEFKIAGEGAEVDRLEYEVKLYLALSGANHDAAVTAWGMKGYYDSARPTSFVRYLGESGQSSDDGLPNYNPIGLPLIPGQIEQIVASDVAPGGRFEDLVELVYEPLSGEPIGVNDHVGDLVVRCWTGGFSAGTTTGVSASGPIPAHVLRDSSNVWSIGSFFLDVDDTPGALNAGQSVPAALQINEIRLDQTGLDPDEYFEIAGPPGTSLDGIWYVVLGDEVQTKVPDSQGRVQVAIDLSGETIPADGTLLVAKGSFSMGTPDLTRQFVFAEIGNCTHFLVTDFIGYLGLECDFFDDGVLDFTPWTTVVDSIGLRRKPGAVGIYSPLVLGPQNSKQQLYGVDWILADRWMAYQASNFVTPPFAGYTSGHSTFSRSAAEVLTSFTGSPYFPGGLFEEHASAGSLKFENGPSEDIVLQYVSYYDAADDAGISRIYGGIHPRADDIPGRISGSKVGMKAVTRAYALFEGLANSPDMNFDGVVDGADIGLFLSSWGIPSTGADFNGDGVVDGADLGLLLSQWSM